MNAKNTSFVDANSLYTPEPGMVSFVSYPNRCNHWGNAGYRGNCDGRLFKNLVLRYRAQRVADPMVGSGTTRDVVKGLNTYGRHHIKFWGGDIKAGFNLLRQDPPKGADFIWIHPPYWNIIRYSDHPDDLSTMDDYQQFSEALAACLRRCHETMATGGRLAVLMGDVRRQGRYTPIIRELLNLEGDIGTVCSIIIKAQHNCRSDAKTYAAMPDVPIKHEYCVVFKKL